MGKQSDDRADKRNSQSIKKMSMKKMIWYILIWAGCFMFASCSNEPITVDAGTPPAEEGISQSYPIYSNPCGLWKDYVSSQSTGEESTLLDFSYAGYEFGELAVPDVDYPIFNVLDYGAIPNDGLSDRQAFVEAIEAVEARGGKAVIYFPKGRYDLRPKEAENASIVIDADNVVLRGEGAGEGGTELFMEYPNQALDETLWNTPELLTFSYARSKSDDALLLTEVVGNAARGSHQLQVSTTSGMHIGQRVLLKLAANNAPELVAEEVAPYEVHPEWTELPNVGVQVTEYHQVVRIEGNLITFKEPIMHKVDARWGWTIHRHQHRVGCGVEDIAFVGNFEEDFEHHKNALHDSGYRMLTFHRQVNGWIRRCRFTNVSEAASIMLSANVSVYDCLLSGRQGHSAIRAQASSRIFMGKIKDEPAQYHSVGVSKTAIGNVLWRNHTAANSCFEAHSSQPRATLIDACVGGFLPNHAGGDAALGPNHLGDLVLWNYTATGGSGEFNLWERNNRFLMPIIAGFRGNVTFRPEQVTADEKHGSVVEPFSLYEAQLINRLGALPQWLNDLKNKRE